MASNMEEDFFAREEIEAKRRLALKQATDTAAKEKEALAAAHHMKCPKCGLDLHSLEKGTVQIDTCFNCGGIWLDKGELEQIVKSGDKHPNAVMGAILNFVYRDTKK